jgi:prolyl-tRNA editing enzyme YbaK/EbsC (Cys-tRNA(Pro) deacylase)
MSADEALVDPAPAAGPLSTQMTDRPPRASSSATDAPMMPAPMTTASASALELLDMRPTVHAVSPGAATAAATRMDRMSDIERAVRVALERTGIAFEIVACDPALADTAAFCEAYEYSLDESANTIVVAGRSDPPKLVACIVLATTRLDVNGVVRRRLEVRKASFASADDTMAATGMSIGGVTAFALPPDLPIWVDAAVMRRERLILGGGSRSMKVLVAPEALQALPNVTVVEGLANPLPST